MSDEIYQVTWPSIPTAKDYGIDQDRRAPAAPADNNYVELAIRRLKQAIDTYDHGKYQEDAPRPLPVVFGYDEACDLYEYLTKPPPAGSGTVIVQERQPFQFPPDDADGLGNPSVPADVAGLIERLRKPLGAHHVSTGFWLAPDRADEVCIERREAADAIAALAHLIGCILAETGEPTVTEACMYVQRLRADLERTRAALRGCDCPLPIKADRWTVGECVDTGKCRCYAGTPLAAPQEKP